MKNKYTMKQRMELTEQVNNLIKQGLTRKNAIRNVGISDASFYRWTKLAKRKLFPVAGTYTQHTYDGPNYVGSKSVQSDGKVIKDLPSRKLALFVGSVDDVLECYRRLS